MMPRPPAFALLVALSLTAACGEQRGPIVFGMAGPFDEGFGRANRLGAELAMRQINAANGIKGDSLHIRFMDDGGEGSRAASIAQAFVENDSIVAVVGHVTSGAMEAAARVYDGQLTAVATTASSASLSGISSWVFRVISSDVQNSVDLAKFATRLGKKRVAILYENNAYGRGLADNFRKAFVDSVIGLDAIPTSGDGAEIYVSWIASRRPDLVFVAGTERSGIAILREARRQKVTAEFLGGDGWTGVVADSSSEGALVGAPFTPLDPRPRAQEFVTAYREAYGHDPDGNAALAYDAVKLLASAVEAVGRDRAKIREWLATRTGESAHPGVTGTIAFDSLGDPAGQAFTMTRIVRGKLTVAERDAP